MSVQSFAGVDYAGVRGGSGSRAPHFIVNEFGGSVWWRGKGVRSGFSGRHISQQQKRARTAGSYGSFFGRQAGHIIPVRERSPMNVVTTWNANIGAIKRVKSKRFPAGWFFFRTAAKETPHIIEQHAEAMARLTRKLFGKL